MPAIRSLPVLPTLGAVGTLTLGVLLCMNQAGEPEAPAREKPQSPDAKASPGYWKIEDVRPGMRGHGLTVMKGTKIETFQAEIIGVLKNTSPGRDLILCKLSGLGLDRTGIIAGMSGSPVYIEGKLLGAVAFGWSYGKDPIGGITPFCQMRSYVESFERRDLAEKGKPQKVGSRHTLSTPIAVGDRTFDSVSVAAGYDHTADRSDDDLALRPLQMPLIASGFTPHSLNLLRDKVREFGLVPMQGGGAGGVAGDDLQNVKLEPGGPLAISMIRGDFDLSGIGTVTHVDGDRVYGWGHPFMGLGSCDFPLMTGYIHTIFPRLTVSFKMGVPLQPVGVINADTSTGIAGWLGRKPDMMPVRMSVTNGEDAPTRTFNVEVARQKTLLSSLIFTALTNSVDMEGELPEEMTADLEARIEIDGGEPLVLKDTFSGFSGGRAPHALYSNIASVVGLLTNNPYQQIRIKRIDCTTKVRSGRRSADIEAVQLDSEVYSPGDTVKARVYLRPYKGLTNHVEVQLKLPEDMPEGRYTASLGDDPAAARADLRDDPLLNNPQNADQVLATVRKLLVGRRTYLAMRVSLGGTGVTIDGKNHPNLPDSMVQILGSSRKSGSQTIRDSLTGRVATNWVIQGSESASFRVSKNKKLTLGN